MTIQISDTVFFERKHFVLLGVSGGQLFDPADFGVAVQAMSTGCVRGYHVDYSVDDDRSNLSKLASWVETIRGRLIVERGIDESDNAFQRAFETLDRQRDWLRESLAPDYRHF